MVADLVLDIPHGVMYSKVMKLTNGVRDEM